MATPTRRVLPRAIVVLLIAGAALAVNVILLPPRYVPKVESVTLTREPMVLTVRASGVLQPKRSYTWKAPFDGPVLNKAYEEGKPVKAGDALIEISRERIQADYDAKRMALKNAEADFIAAKKTLRLQQSLFGRQAVARSSVEDAQRSLLRSEQIVGVAKAALEATRRLWEQNRVSAPFDGLLLKDFLGSETEVTAGRDVFTLADVSEYEVSVMADELDIGKIAIGQPADVQIQAFEGKTLKARVKRIGAKASELTAREVPVYLTLESGAGDALLPRLTVSARIEVGATPPVLSVPLSAIANPDGKPKVWVIRPSGRLVARLVTLGRGSRDGIEVINGLAEGERICTSAERRFFDGQRVALRG
jgi:RND family efflux transporter MFP subunit